MSGETAELTCPGDTHVSVSLATAAMMQHLITAANTHLLRPRKQKQRRLILSKHQWPIEYDERLTVYVAAPNTTVWWRL